MKRRRFLQSSLCRALPAAAIAAPWVQRVGAAQPARILAHTAAGGMGDVVSRRVARFLEPTLGMSFVIDHRPGGGGALLVNELKRSAPDGRTLAVVVGTGLCVQSRLRQPPPYDLQTDLTLITRYGHSSFALSAHPDSGFRTVADALAAARRESGRINVGSTGIGSHGHLLLAQLEHRAGVRFNHVPFNPADSALALLRGEVPLLVDGLGFLIEPIRAGKARALGVMGPERRVALPDVPTLAEQGIPGVDQPSWWMVIGPPRMAAETVAQVHDAVVRMTENPDYRREVAEGLITKVFGPQELPELVRREQSLWAEVISRVGIKVT